ncbi:MAG: class I SAM-dependent methyltransferase [Proteobacteria bacterium]|nr:class I SAM-dependent methyltransferase [Pseudomonadota bacterium]NOG59109.1 class I SAM-dependent methyltransferase [Pseudomonadota bacterium]
MKNKKESISNNSSSFEGSEISEFFDEMSHGRNEKINANPIVDYEQNVRSEIVLNYLSPKSGDKILDIGCGNARDIAYILEQGAEIIGIDISEGMILEAKKDLEKLGYKNVTLEVGDATNLAYADNQFDKVLCSEVIEHIPNADKALNEMWRILKPGGHLILSTPNPNSWYGFDRYIIWEKIFRKEWPHPYDNWRSLRELLFMTKTKGFITKKTAGVCYIPGFIITYFVLPKFIQHPLISIIRIFEPFLSRRLPQFGYMVCAVVEKNKS